MSGDVTLDQTPTTVLDDNEHIQLSLRDHSIVVRIHHALDLVR